MSEEIMETFNSETSSESDSVKSPMKGNKPQSPSPRKLKIAYPITNENSNSSSDIPLSSIVTKKRTKLATSSEADAESSTSADTEKQNIKLVKLASSTEYKSSEKKKERNHISKKVLANGSKKNNKSKLQVISDDLDTSPVKRVDSGLNSSVMEAREEPKSDANKIKSVKSEQLSEKKSLKRKWSGEIDIDQVKAKTKRKLNITSDSSSDDAVEAKSVTQERTPSKKKGRPVSTRKKETVPATIDNKSSPPKSKSKPGPASSKKNKSSVENGITVSPTKTAHISDSESSSPKPVDAKEANKLSKNNILKELDNSSNISNSSEDSEVEDISNDENKDAASSNSSSESDEDSDAPLNSSKGKKKVVQQRKSKGTTNSESSASDSDNLLSSKNETKASSGETEKLSDDSSSGSSSNEDDSENVLPKKKKVMQNAEKTLKKETVKEKRPSSANDSDDPLPSKNETKASSGEAEDIPGESSSGSSSSEDESESVSLKKKKVQQKDEKSSKKETIKNKRKPGDNPRIVRLQRYLKEAGIRVQNYNTLWQDCKSDKARAERLMDLLRERGLKRKPSVSECRKLKKKFEREKEVSELNTSNIITSNGRSRRGVTGLFATHRSTSPSSAKKQEISPKKSPEFKKMFGRLREIVDSEESE